MKIITNNILNGLFHFLSETENFVFLDTSKPDSTNNRSHLFLDPVDRLLFHKSDDVATFLETLQQKQEQGFYVAGWFSYEFGYLLEPSLKGLLQKNEDQDALLADLGVFRKHHVFDHVSGEHNFPLGVSDHGASGYGVANLRATQQKEDYIQALESILQYIEAGDTYQVNYTLKLLFEFSGSPEKFYRDLRSNQSVGYGAYIRWGDEKVMSFSPELFFRKNGSEIMVRPMKGTLKRGRTIAEDAHNIQFLRTDVKNQSENVMIVDLLRNDLGRLMHHVNGGRVEVESLFDVETYETLLQMTSTIYGRCGERELDSLSLYDFFKAIFPCGSVTGAPKIRTMEIIDELEQGRRGVYTGAIGYMLPGGESVFNVPIRTVVLDGEKGEMGIGSGIVHDSVPEQEWQECLLKGRFLTNPQKPFQIIESLLWREGEGYFLLQAHLRRLKESADFFLFQFDPERATERLMEEAENLGDGCHKVRLLLYKDGNLEVSSVELADPVHFELDSALKEKGQSLARICLATERVDSRSLWLYHKTTNREIYNKGFKEAGSLGAADLIFQNENGYITEGCISNLLIYRDGEYFTPPLEDGLLGGIMRQHLLKKNGSLKEKSLTVEDLKSADKIFLCNSVRGITPVTLSWR